MSIKKTIMLNVLKNFVVTGMRFARQCHGHSYPACIRRDQSMIYVIPAGKNNYMFVIADHESNDAVAIDPVDIEQVSNLVKKRGLNLRCVLTTHYLLNHAGGNRAAAARFPRIPIYGGDDRVQNVTKLVTKGETIKYGPLSIKCLLDPEESSGHVIYVVKNLLDKKRVHAFVGDAFSIAGFGNYPESHKKHLYKILTQDIANLSDNTEIYCGHESAIRNLNIAMAIEPNNPIIQKKLAWALEQRDNNEPTVPSYIYEEKKYNPFLRLGVPEVQGHFGTSSAQDTLLKLRKKITQWKSRSLF